MYNLLDLDANLSFLTPYLAIRFDISHEILLEPFSVYTPIGDSILAMRVYRNYSVLVLHKVAPCDLIKLDMIAFDIILGMNRLDASYASIDYRTRREKF